MKAGMGVVFLAVMVTLTVGAPSASASDVEGSFAFRETFLPPGPPSVALRDDETAILWNPAGLPHSRTYYLGYTWKSVYLAGHQKTITHFFLTKARGFATGFVRDNISEGVKTATVLSIAPEIWRGFSLGFTGKWKGKFNYDLGAMLRIRRRVSLGIVGRNIRHKPDVRRYWEGGIGIYAIPGKLTFFCDVVQEDSPWREEIGYGCGLTLRLRGGFVTRASYFDDGSGNGIIRASLVLTSPATVLEGEYSSWTKDWETMAVRLASRSR